MQRIFLGHERPPLHATADWIVQSFVCDGRLDLGYVILSLPGARAGRRLEELLLARAEKLIDAGRIAADWVPPRIVTIGQLPEELYFVSKPQADELLQEMVWLKALRNLAAESPELLASLLPQTQSSGLTAEYACATLFARLHRELASDMLDCNDVAQKIHIPREAKRWDVLHRLQQRYLYTLDTLGYWDIQTARRIAIERGEVECQKQVVLVGMTDLNQAQERLLAAVTPEVISLVFAPESWQDRFDEWGRVIPEAWAEVHLQIDDEQIIVVEKPQEQAIAAAQQINRIAEQESLGASDVVIGIPDEEIVPSLQSEITQRGGKTRLGEGVPMSASPVIRLLETTAAFLASRRFEDYAALVRLPEVEAVLVRHCTEQVAREGQEENDASDEASTESLSILTPLDIFHELYLPQDLGDNFSWTPPKGMEAKRLRLSPREQACLVWSWELLQSLWRALPSSPVLLSDVVTPLNHYLEVFFAAEPHGQQSAEALEIISSECREWESLPETVVPRINTAEAVSFLVRRLAAKRLTAALHADRDAVELLGWLELPMDDAKVLIVTGMNEGIVPSSDRADAFLPDGVRRRLNIDHYDRRAARDACAMATILATREHVVFVAGRQSLDGSSRFPSRFLFTADAETLTRRVNKFLQASPDQTSSEQTLPDDVSDIVNVARGKGLGEKMPPRPAPLAEPVTSMTVSEFRDYLVCPYRYYLKHRLRLASLSDASQEWDGATFGSVAHEVLAAFGRSQLRSATTPEPIADFLTQHLEKLLRERLGTHPRASVAVQVEQLRKRFAAFAKWQAAWASEGYQIVQTEMPANAEIVVDDAPMQIRGRFDRIDFNKKTGELVVLDYKTSDSAQTPEKTHGVKESEKSETVVEDWTDLQLPLYDLMVRQVCPDLVASATSISVGYIILPKDLKQTGVKLAPWGASELASALAAIENVIRNVRSEVFFPPASPPPSFDDYAALFDGA